MPRFRCDSLSALCPSLPGKLIFLSWILSLWLSGCGGSAAPLGAEEANPAPRLLLTGNSLAKLAGWMRQESWAVLETSGLENGKFLETASPGKSVLQWADKATWDPKTRQFRFLGSPHYEPFKHIIYAEADNAWRAGPLPFPPDTLVHGYEHNTIDAATGESYFREYGTTKVFKYSPATNSWSSLPSIPSQSIQCCGALEWFPERHGLLFVDGDWGVFFFDAGAQKWTRIANTKVKLDANAPQCPMGSYSNFASYSPKQKVVLFGGGGSSAIYRLDASGKITKLAKAPIELGIGSSIVTVDPVSGKHLVFGGDKSFWEYDVSADAWRSLGASCAPIFDAPNTPAVFDIVAAPVSTYGVIMFVKYSPGQAKVYLYKHIASTPTGQK